MLSEAATERAAGRIVEAIDAYRRVLAASPDHLGARCAIAVLERQQVSKPIDLSSLIQSAEAAYSQGDIRTALASFERALEQSPGQRDLRAATARCHRELRQHKKAEAILAALLEEEATHFPSLLGMAELEDHRQHPAAAIRWYRLALDQRPDHQALRATLALCLLRSGEWDAAQELLEHALRDSPHEPTLLVARRDLHAASGELEQALALSQQLLAVDSATPWHHLSHVHLLRQLRRFEEALIALEAFDPGDNPVLEAQGFHARGVLLREWGRLPESLAALRSAVDGDPTCPDHPAALASLLAEIGAFDEGLSMLHDSERHIGAAQGLGHQPWLQFAKVTLYRGAGDLEAALAISDGLAADDRVGFHARVQRAQLLMQLGDPRAEQAVEAIDPDGPEQERVQSFCRAEWLRNVYRFDQAAAELAPLLEAEPIDFAAAELACLLHTMLMDLDQALALFARIRDAKAASGNPRLVESARHGLQRCLIEEFNTNLAVTSTIRDLWSQTSAQRLAPLAALVASEPGSSAAAISLLIAARQVGGLDAWEGSMVEARANTAPVEGPIPRVVVQFWNSSPPPDGVRALMQSWPQTNPAFTHRVFGTETAAAFLATHGSRDVQDAFDAALSPVLQADLFRLAYLFHHGGIYADADDRCRKSLAPLLGEGIDLVLHQEDIGSIGNNFIASAPGHPLIERALAMACKNVLEAQGDTPWFLTGPGVMSLSFVALYGEALANPAAPPPPGLRLLTQHQLSRRISFHLQTPVKVSEGSWSAPRGQAGHQRLMRRRR